MNSIPRRQALKALGAAGAGALIGVAQADAVDAPDAAGSPIVIAGARVQVVLEPVSRQTVRVSLLPAEGARAATAQIPLDGSLVKPSWSKAAARITALSPGEERVRAGDLAVIVSRTPTPTAPVTRSLFASRPLMAAWCSTSALTRSQAY